ncbi:MAG: 50S ribosomal protein L6 [Candidatus Vogelbacteria bacterium]|nr:50S ribosomal protein L6 [Candidatus Vogelbacteria bacterium]
MIGKRIITIPEKVEVNLASGVLTMKGPLGTLTREFKSIIEININDKEITLAPQKTDVDTCALWGTYGSHIANMILGVTKGYEKKMQIEGVGYKVNVVGDKMVLEIGLSHDVEVPIPEGIKAVSDKSGFAFSGIDKELVGQFAAKIRAYKKTEPYKGKGIRYVGEFIRRKQGKKSTA